MTSVEITYLFRDVQGRTVHVDVLGARNCWSHYATGMSEWAQKIDLLHPFFCFKMDQNGPFMIFLLFRMVHLWFFCCSKWFIYDFSVVQKGSFMIFLFFKTVHLWFFCCSKGFIYVFSVFQNGSFMIFPLFKMVHLWFFCCSKWFIYDFSVVEHGSFMTFLLLNMVHLWFFCCSKWFIYDFSVVEHGSFMTFLLLLLFSKMLIECCCAVDLGSENAKTEMLQHPPRDAEYETRMILGWCFPWIF